MTTPTVNLGVTPEDALLLHMGLSAIRSAMTPEGRDRLAALQAYVLLEFSKADPEATEKVQVAEAIGRAFHHGLLAADVEAGR